MFKKFLCVAYVAVTMSLAFISSAKAETKLGDYDDVIINVDRNSEKKIGNSKYVTHVGEFSVERTGVSLVSVYVDTKLKDARYSLTYLVISSKDSSGSIMQKIKVPFMYKAVSFEIATNKEFVYELSIESDRRIIKNVKKDKVKVKILTGGIRSDNDDVSSMFITNAGNKDTSEFTTINFVNMVKDEKQGG